LNAGAISPRAGADATLSRRETDWIRVQADLPNDGRSDIGNWHLVRTPGPDKGGDIVSIMHTVDALQSDPDFAGMVIRCRPRSALQIAFVLITPLPPRSRPQLTISVNHSTARFQGDALPPGSMVALPDEADVLAKGPWQAASQLRVDIERDADKIHGVVPLGKIGNAIAYLQANCPQR
jgi:hypothetical protein